MIQKLILALMQLPGISRKTIHRYLEIPAGAVCDTKTLQRILQKGALNTSRVRAYTEIQLLEAIEKADAILRECDREQIQIITYPEEEFPKRLKQISDPPAVLYYRGNIRTLNERACVAIVGTRQPTKHGFAVAQNLGGTFARRGCVVVSGLASGCDTGAHMGCLAVHGITAAVIAGGPESIYPRSNEQLARRILEQNGILLSEYPPGTQMHPGHFVERDRLQSGLCDGVVVVETGSKGGTLHTVESAVKEQRCLAAYLHPEEYRGEAKTLGNQWLIQEGKALPLSNNDDLDTFVRMMSENMAAVTDESMDLSRKGDVGKDEAYQMTLFDFISE